MLEYYHSTKQNKYLGVLLQRYTTLLFAVCMKYLKNEEEAKDAVQQIFFKSITELEKYKVEYFKSWVYMVAKNHCLMFLRNKNRVIPKDWEEKEHPIAFEETIIEDHLEKEKMLTLVENGLQELSEDQQQCVTLFYLQKQSYTQISSATGFSLLQVKSFIQNGKRNIRIWVEKQMQQK